MRRSTPPFPSFRRTTASRFTKSSGACGPRAPRASLSSSRRASSCTRSSSPTSSPPSPPSRTASSSATSPTAPAASTTCPRARSTCTCSCTSATAVSSPIDSTTVPVLYIFVEIAINTRKLLHELNYNFTPDQISNFVMAGTIQFSNAIRSVKPELEKLGFTVLIPQSRPLSAGEVLGCTAPSVKLHDSAGKDNVIIFVADGRFHLEAFMIANPDIRAFRYDPYLGKLFLEEYDHDGMKENRRKAIGKAKGAKTWGIMLGTLGRQGNQAALNRLEGKMRDKGLDYMVVLISELSPMKIELFSDAVEAWVQIACPRLSIDWGDAFKKPLLTTFEAEIALGDLAGWWERKSVCNDSLEGAKKEGCCGNENLPMGVDYPMDYYAQDGGEWNSSYSKKLARDRGKRDQCCNGSSVRC